MLLPLHSSVKMSIEISHQSDCLPKSALRREGDLWLPHLPQPCVLSLLTSPLAPALAPTGQRVGGRERSALVMGVGWSGGLAAFPVDLAVGRWHGIL